jgi:hypothetical protein
MIKIVARKRVYWFYLIMALIIFFFYVLVLQDSPYQVNYNYSDMFMKKLLNVQRSVKLSLLYFFFVSTTSLVGYAIGSIIKDPSYQKSFIISFLLSSIIGGVIFFYFIIL